jgi:hypothetical protein
LKGVQGEDVAMALFTPNKTHTQNQLKNKGTLLQSILYECNDLLAG